MENGDESDLLKEKQLQLDILGNILGVPIASKNLSDNKEVEKDSKFSKYISPTFIQIIYYLLCNIFCIFLGKR